MTVSRRGNGVLGGPRDMEKAGLPEPQSPADVRCHPPEMRPMPVSLPVLTWLLGRHTLRERSDSQ